MPTNLPATGRTGHCLHNWLLITGEEWTLETISGMPLILTSPPLLVPIQTVRNQRQIPRDHKSLIDSEIQTLIGKNAITKMTEGEVFLSSIFTVPKKNGGHRMILDLRNLNQHLTTSHFKIEGIQMLRDLVLPGEYMKKLDLTHAYMSIPIAKRYHKYLAFQWRDTYYTYQVLPFGLSIAPRVFTKVMKAPISILRTWSIRLIIYLDDILIVNQTHRETQQDTELTIALLQHLGFVINMKKSILAPTQEI